MSGGTGTVMVANRTDIIHAFRAGAPVMVGRVSWLETDTLIIIAGPHRYE